MGSSHHLFALFVLTVLTAGCVSRSPATPAEPSPPPPPATLAPPTQPPSPTGTITLAQAEAAVLAAHPDLAVLRAERAARDGEILQAGLRENPRLGLSYEDFGGSGDLTGVDAAETTLAISQEFPLNDALARRETAIRLAADLIDGDLQARALDLRGEVRLAFAKAAAAQQRLALRRLNEELVQRLVEGVERRVESGDVSPIERTKARVDLSSARLDRRRAERELTSAYARLAALWGAETTTFEAVEAPESVVPLPSIGALRAALKAHPAMQRWQAERAAREADLRLAEAEARPSLEVGAGVRHFNESGDHAFLVEISLPLPLFNRNQGAIAAAAARLGGVEASSQTTWRALTGELLPLHADLVAQRAVIDDLRAELLPAAEATYEAVKTAYDGGQSDLLDLLDAERAVLTARGSLIEAETEYQVLQATLEALLGTPLQAIHPAPAAPEKEIR